MPIHKLPKISLHKINPRKIKHILPNLRTTHKHKPRKLRQQARKIYHNPKAHKQDKKPKQTTQRKLGKECKQNMKRKTHKNPH